MEGFILITFILVMLIIANWIGEENENNKR